jgi:hypothetical protein
MNMKVKLNSEGDLIVKSESEIEEFALLCWNQGDASITLDHGWKNTKTGNNDDKKQIKALLYKIDVMYKQIEELKHHNKALQLQAEVKHY